jgi:hypothetical protein
MWFAVPRQASRLHAAQHIRKLESSFDVAVRLCVLTLAAAGSNASVRCQFHDEVAELVV